MSHHVTEELVHLEQIEQRRYRRLEVSLPVWLAEEDDFDRPGQTPWSLGYTRDISMGGAKVYVPETEEKKWQEMEARGANCLIRFDVPGCSPVEYISCHLRRAAREMDTGRFWIGIEYNTGNADEKAAAMRAGMRTMKSRRHWQGAFFLRFWCWSFRDSSSTSCALMSHDRSNWSRRRKSSAANLTNNSVRCRAPAW
jgi:hypothetical protein